MFEFIISLRNKLLTPSPPTIINIEAPKVYVIKFGGLYRVMRKGSGAIWWCAAINEFVEDDNAFFSTAVSKFKTAQEAKDLYFAMNEIIIQEKKNELA